MPVKQDPLVLLSKESNAQPVAKYAPLSLVCAATRESTSGVDIPDHWTGPNLEKRTSSSSSMDYLKHSFLIEFMNPHINETT